MLTPEQTAKRITYDPVFAIGENVRDMMAAHIAHAIKDAVRVECERCVRGLDGMLRSTLGQALQQWKMYAEMEPERDLKTEVSPEAEMYRAALAVAERK